MIGVLLSLASALPGAGLDDAASGFAETVLSLPPDGTRLAFRDADGDGVSELFWIHRQGVGVRFLREDGTYPEANDASLAWPHADLAWDLADLDGDGGVEIVVLEDARRFRAWRVRRDEGMDEGRLVLDEVGGELPRGRRRVRFARDVNGDERMDLVVPASDRYRIFLSDGEQGWSEPIEVSFDADIGFELGDPDRLDEKFGMDVNIPWFELEDVDGDGRIDLVSETDELVQFHLASPDLPAEPTWRLDKTALREGSRKKREIDFQDLFALVQGRVDWAIEDIDGKPPADLILQQGSTFKLYLGGSRTGNLRSPDDLLKSSGHVLTFLLHDVDGDELPELLMIRAEKVSLGRVVRWLVIPGSLDFDVFVYKNEGTGFGKRPASRVAISLKIPRLLSFFEELDGMEGHFEASLEMPTTVGIFDRDGLRNDVVDLLGEEVMVFRDRAPEERIRDWRELQDFDFDTLVEDFLIDQIDDLEDGEVQELDLRDVKDLDLSPADELRAACAGHKPSITHPLRVLPAGAALEIVDIDGDGRSDLVLIEELPEAGARHVQILVSR